MSLSLGLPSAKIESVMRSRASSRTSSSLRPTLSTSTWLTVRKALGAKRRAILVQFLIEAAGITLGAGLLGLGIAWPATWAIDRFTSFAAEMSWWIVAVALLLSVFTGVIAGFIPAWRASRLDPVEALRAE